jgi:hypothetical protein
MSAKLVTRGGKPATEQRECLIDDAAFCDADESDADQAR